MLKPIRKHRFHVSTRTPKSLQNELQKGALESQFGTRNGKSAIQEMIKKKRENTTSENMQNQRKSVSKLDVPCIAFWALFGLFLALGFWVCPTPENHAFWAKIHQFL